MKIRGKKMFSPFLLLKTGKGLVLVKAFVAVILFLFCYFLTSCPVNASNEFSAISDVETINVPQAKMKISYPKADKPNIFNSISLRPRPPEGGAFAQLGSELHYGDIILSRILFHTLDSCKKYEKELENYKYSPDDVGESEGVVSGYPEYWYTSTEFLNQKKSFDGLNIKSKYKFTKIKEMKYWSDCLYDTPSGGYISDNITFVNNIRVLFQFSSNKNCDEISGKINNVLSQFHFSSN